MAPFLVSIARRPRAHAHGAGRTGGTAKNVCLTRNGAKPELESPELRWRTAQGVCKPNYQCITDDQIGSTNPDAASLHPSGRDSAVLS